MRKTFNLLILLFIILLSNVVVKSETSMGVDAVSIKSRSVILDEWQNPGKYSPVNVFDGDINTCAAESGRGNDIRLEIHFKNEINIDEIRLMNGFGKNIDLFKKNNRAGKLSIYLNLKTKLVKKEILMLEDRQEFQTFNFKESYKIDKISLLAFGSEVYKGTTYNDTCITEIEFYYKGKKILINNIDNLRNDYLKRLDNTLRDAFNNREYTEAQAGYSRIFFGKNGTVDFSDAGSCNDDDVFVCTSKFVPRFWSIKNSKLYMRNSNNESWKLTRYEFLYDYGEENYPIRSITIFKDSSDDDSGFVMRDKLQDEIVHKRMIDRKEKKKN